MKVSINVTLHCFGGMCLLLPAQIHLSTKGSKCQEKRSYFSAGVVGPVNRGSAGDSVLLREEQVEELKGEDPLGILFSLSHGKGLHGHPHHGD